jgi:hypothetical protein
MEPETVSEAFDAAEPFIREAFTALAVPSVVCQQP